MKKKLDTEAIQNELAGSVFFPSRTTEPAPPERNPLPHEHTPVQDQLPTTHTTPALLASEKASSNASKHASTLALSADLQGIHKIVKFIGKEVLYVRLTQEEKNQVADIEYTYQRQGIKTSGNEIGRIALNVLLADYKAHGEQSILAKMLAELHT
jgi:hypothetical protein